MLLLYYSCHLKFCFVFLSFFIVYTGNITIGKFNFVKVTQLNNFCNNIYFICNRIRLKMVSQILQLYASNWKCYYPMIWKGLFWRQSIFVVKRLKNRKINVIQPMSEYAYRIPCQWTVYNFSVVAFFFFVIF